MRTQPLIPLRVYDDMEAAQEFLVDVFGFKRGRLERDPSVGRSTPRYPLATP